ncbi:MAG: hypothetical protein KF752_00170 [Pirellulaceae bacterium]|nr:hypothetical protein [Pirellulaceae bacterium]
MARLFNKLRPSFARRRANAEVRYRTAVPCGSAALSDDKLQFHQQQLLHLVTHRQLSDHQRRGLSFLVGHQTIACSRLMKGVNFVRSSAADLQTMAELYDQHFLGGHCLALARNCGLHFRWSSRMTSNGGKTVRTVRMDHRLGRRVINYEIVLSGPLLFQTFSDLERPIRVTGALCSNRLQAMQRIMEHELVHLIEMLLWNESCCAAPRFQAIAGRLFGHSEHKHDLITQQERADRKFNVRVGTRVCFQFDGRLHTGTVNRITRRATVLVVDPAGQLYEDGQRYSKYYVPLAQLAPAVTR